MPMMRITTRSSISVKPSWRSFAPAIFSFTRSITFTSALESGINHVRRQNHALILSKRENGVCDFADPVFLVGARSRAGSCRIRERAALQTTLDAVVREPLAGVRLRGQAVAVGASRSSDLRAGVVGHDSGDGADVRRL